MQVFAAFGKKNDAILQNFLNDFPGVSVVVDQVGNL